MMSIQSPEESQNDFPTIGVGIITNSIPYISIP